MRAIQKSSITFLSASFYNNFVLMITELIFDFHENNPFDFYKYQKIGYFRDGGFFKKNLFLR